MFLIKVQIIENIIIIFKTFKVHQLGSSIIGYDSVWISSKFHQFPHVNYIWSDNTTANIILDFKINKAEIVVQDNTVKYYVDNSEVTGITDTVASTSLDIRIRVNAGHSVTIKDFKVYTI